MLSIIVPIYNTIDTIDRCLNSLVKQDVEDMEIILVDDGSNDGSQLKCDEWKNNYDCISVIHKTNGGLSDARNNGIQKARGELITFVDADDFIQENTYRPIVEYFSIHPEYDIVEYPIFVNFGSENEYVTKFENLTYCSFKDYWINGKGYNHSYACNKVFRKRLFQDVKFPVGVVFEDLHTMPKLMKIAKCLATVNMGVYYYCCNDKGITANANAEALSMMLDAYMQVVKEYPDMLNDNDFYMQLINRQIMSYVADGKKPVIPQKHIYNIKSIDKKSYRWKARIVNICGITNLCRISKWNDKFRKLVY